MRFMGFGKQKLYYMAYGSNLSTVQMDICCYDAKKVSKGYLEGYKLEFRGQKDNGHLTIAKAEGEKVPVLIWKISKIDEKALDIFEGYPRYYHKETFLVETEDGKTIEAMAYVMNEQELAMPSDMYLETVLDGCDEAGFGWGGVFRAITEVQKSILQAEKEAEENSIEEMPEENPFEEDAEEYEYDDEMDFNI